MIDIDALRPGFKVPVFRREGTLHHWNRFAAVNDEFADHHMDDAAGRHEGFSAAFIMAPLEHAYLHAMLRDWLGEQGRIVSIDIRLRNPLTRGRWITAGGEITEVRRQGAELICHLEVWEIDDLDTRLASGPAVVAITP